MSSKPPLLISTWWCHFPLMVKWVPSTSMLEDTLTLALWASPWATNTHLPQGAVLRWLELFIIIIKYLMVLSRDSHTGVVYTMNFTHPYVLDTICRSHRSSQRLTALTREVGYEQSQRRSAYSLPWKQCRKPFPCLKKIFPLFTGDGYLWPKHNFGWFSLI